MSTDWDALFTKDLEERPQVYATLRRLALETIRATSGDRIGMKQIAEVARWQHRIASGDDGFRINNGLLSRYARLLAEREPELADAFEFRSLHNAAEDRRQFDHIHIEESGQVAMPV